MSDQSPKPDVEKRPPNNNLLFAGIVLLVIIIAAAFVLLKPSEEPTTTTHVEEPIKEQPMMELKPQNDPVIGAPSVEPEKPTQLDKPAQRPTEAEPEIEPLPTLNKSDPVVVENLHEYLGDTAMSLVVNDDIIRRGVVYIDNLAKGKVATKHSPVERPKESFSVIEGDILTIDPNSYERYTPYVKIFTSMSAAQIVRMYENYKPLINEAYTEIGYEGDAFNQTLEEAIDLLLDTPDPKGEMPLVHDSVTYQYAYSEWENLPAAQKQLLRMGPENMKKVKTVLRNVKAELEKQ